MTLSGEAACSEGHPGHRILGQRAADLGKQASSEACPAQGPAPALWPPAAGQLLCAARTSSLNSRTLLFPHPRRLWCVRLPRPQP